MAGEGALCWFSPGLGLWEERGGGGREFKVGKKTAM